VYNTEKGDVMSEFERTPESMKAELAELKLKKEEIDEAILALIARRDNGEISEKDFDSEETKLGKQGDKINSTTFELLLALNDLEGIQTKLAAYADSVAEEMGEDMPISATEMLMSTFGVYEPETIPAEVKAIISELSNTYPIFSDDEAAEQEGIMADSDWEPTEE
jgi:hypothetical protein